jgi:hypothetical protein
MLNSHCPYLQAPPDGLPLAIPSSVRFLKTLDSELASFLATSTSLAVPNRARAACVQSVLRDI